MDDRIVIGMDIGSSGIYATAGKVDAIGNIEIVAKVEKLAVGIDKGRITDFDKACECLGETFKELENNLSEGISGAFITVPNGLCELVHSKGIITISNKENKISQEDIIRVKESAKLISLPEGKKIIQLVEEMYLVDGQKVKEVPLGISGKHLELNAQVVTMDNLVFNDFERCFSKINKKLKGIRLSCEAASQLLIDDLDKSRGAILIDIGASKADIAIYSGGNLVALDEVHLGGNNITNDLSYCFNITIEEAEQLKVAISRESIENVDIAKYDKNLILEVINARIEEIVGFIFKVLKGNIEKYDINNIILYGNALINFNDIKYSFSKYTAKNINIVRNEDFKLHNSKFINAWGLVTLVHFELKWRYNSEIVYSEDVKGNAIRINKKNKNNKEDNNFITKMKSFLEDFF
ncbi:cell division protein FtsA [Clostridium amylolyticum]|uniref:Cell division protein FtsA n=1 Tax=Clostridium amylolyticum TaxID=1121298 RepID=A0A1M6D207_9CLOT|nr:cell division FtsA domain-containing protein [Clostridium amylolyticum]SHI67229.1 cell division protein FtsA [Clostridium amylolyticum]